MSAPFVVSTCLAPPAPTATPIHAASYRNVARPARSPSVMPETSNSTVAIDSDPKIRWDRVFLAKRSRTSSLPSATSGRADRSPTCSISIGRKGKNASGPTVGVAFLSLLFVISWVPFLFLRPRRLTIIPDPVLTKAENVFWLAAISSLPFPEVF